MQAQGAVEICQNKSAFFIGKGTDFSEKLRILTDGAKYDVSCSSSGSNRGRTQGTLGNTAACGICHSYTEDGRCVSLLKVLLSNDCAYNCLYCVNRRELDKPRATFEPRELCEIVVNFYRRNYIEGLFLSSAVYKNPDYTMELLIRTVRLLREEYRFNGYIHLKGIPGCDERLIRIGSRYADRMSLNIELPSERSLKLLAPQKHKQSILAPMSVLAENAAARAKGARGLSAGQTTQLIVGASPETDGTILNLSSALYRKFSLKRVYYSAFLLTPDNENALLPAKSQEKEREHRLYQADWLLRFYGFSAEELLDPEENFPLGVDPKSFWALKHPELFPVEVNTVPLEMLIRVPGIGIRSAGKILNARRYKKLDFSDLVRMRVPLKRARHFLTAKGKYEGAGSLLSEAFLAEYSQISLFESGSCALTGEL